MVRPRWLSAQRVTASRLWRHWDRAVELWAGLNLLWVLFDITYIPLRTFWLQRNLTPLPQVPLVVPLTLLPDITPLYDPVKGIEPHRETEAGALKTSAPRCITGAKCLASCTSTTARRP